MARLSSRPVFGAQLSDVGGVELRERLDCGVATILGAGPGPAGWPDGPRRADIDGVTLLGISRRTWLAVGEGGPGMAASFAKRFAGQVHVADQSGAYGVLELSGPYVEAVLAKGLNVDLAPAAFPADGVAASSIAHVGVVLWRSGNGESYHLAAPRSSAGSFMHWLSASAAEFA